jgi:catechol 2,3-dioxygenase-like lactoylglutathione lyase family enzyme
VKERETMMFKRIDHVEIVTDQLDLTVQFYTEVLGFRVKARNRIDRSSLGVPMDLVYLDLGGTVVELICTRALLSSRLRRVSTEIRAHLRHGRG